MENNKNKEILPIAISLCIGIIIFESWFYYEYPFYEIVIDGIKKNIYKKNPFNINHHDFSLKGMIFFILFFIQYSKNKFSKEITIEKNKTTKKEKTILFGLTTILFFSFYTLYIDFGNNIVNAIVFLISNLIWSISTFVLSQIIIEEFGKRKEEGVIDEFPYEKRKIETELSVNIPYYPFGNKKKIAYVNVQVPHGGTVVLGNPGTGKTFSFLIPFLYQLINKNVLQCVYCFKNGELALEAYTYIEKNKENFKKQYGKYPKNMILSPFFPERSNRVNPFSASILEDELSCYNAGKMFFEAMNKGAKDGNSYFSDNAVKLLSSCLIFLRFVRISPEHKMGHLCSIPSLAIILTSPQLKKIFYKVITSHPRIKFMASDFNDMNENEVFETLNSISSTASKVLALFLMPKIAYMLSGEDFTLDINSRENPTNVMIIGNSAEPEMSGMIIAPIISMLMMMTNKPAKIPLQFHLDECVQLKILGIDNLIATARSNKIITTLGFQDMQQLEYYWGKDIAKSIINIVNNKITARASGQTSKMMEEILGGYKYQEQSVSVNNDSDKESMSLSIKERKKIKAEQISNISNGFATGIIADSVEYPSENKVFYGLAKIETEKRVYNLFDRNKEHPIEKFPIQNEKLSKMTIDEKSDYLLQGVNQLEEELILVFNQIFINETYFKENKH